MLIFTIVNLLTQKKQYKIKEAYIGLNKSYLYMLFLFIFAKMLHFSMRIGYYIINTDYQVCFLIESVFGRMKNI